LHTNDAATAVTRLLDLGVEAYLVASSVAGVLAQRLVRKVCQQCGKSVESSQSDRDWLNVDDPKPSLRHGDGCASCRQTGYCGRIGIFEMMMVDDVMRRHVQNHSTASQLKAAATAAGMRTLRDDGIAKILSGMTTIEEVERVTMRATSIETLES
jgi:type II secretory ATPase GspE/PulE/Tfp pilus assembly ATPase PilB-like protein